MRNEPLNLDEMFRTLYAIRRGRGPTDFIEFHYHYSPHFMNDDPIRMDDRVGATEPTNPVQTPAEQLDAAIERAQVREGNLRARRGLPRTLRELTRQAREDLERAAPPPTLPWIDEDPLPVAIPTAVEVRDGWDVDEVVVTTDPVTLQPIRWHITGGGNIADGIPGAPIPAAPADNSVFGKESDHFL